MEAVDSRAYCLLMRATVLSVLMVFGCVFVGCGGVAAQGDASPPSPDAPLPDAPQADAPQPDAPAGPRCDPTQPFLNPTLVANVNSPDEDLIPRLSADELELFFASDRPGGAGGLDLYVARRATRDAEFGTPEPIRELNTSDAEYGPFLASDNLTLYYANRHTLDIDVAMRPSRMLPFSASVPVAGVNTPPTDESEPYLAQNDQVLYFPSSRIGNYDIHRSTRDASGAFGTPMPISEINMPSAVDANPVVASDGLTIYWTTDNGISGRADTWIATRPSTATDFTAAMLHGTLNRPSSNTAPGWISTDGCIIYIYSNRPGGIGKTDIWVARRPM